MPVLRVKLAGHARAAYSWCMVCAQNYIRVRRMGRQVGKLHRRRELDNARQQCPCIKKRSSSCPHSQGNPRPAGARSRAGAAAHRDGHLRQAVEHHDHDGVEAHAHVHGAVDDRVRAHARAQEHRAGDDAHDRDLHARSAPALSPALALALALPYLRWCVHTQQRAPLWQSASRSRDRQCGGDALQYQGVAWA